MFRKIQLVITIVGSIGCIGFSNAFTQELGASTSKEKKILSLVAALPEVQKRAREIRALSRGNTQITLMISANPDIYIPYYQVNVNDNAPTYNNYYQFAVDPKTFQIFYYDPVKNHQYSLAEWRKMKEKNNKGTFQ
ncbi:MAG: hypothetical protein EOO92_21910 [Pedobacter sp.]|nr:MAG: hypothetical protein EOO92_21910 [Pedobacter sp.]